jgi:hypothetical protein
MVGKLFAVAVGFRPTWLIDFAVLQQHTPHKNDLVYIIPAEV